MLLVMSWHCLALSTRLLPLLLGKLAWPAARRRRRRWVLPWPVRALSRRLLVVEWRGRWRAMLDSRLVRQGRALLLKVAGWRPQPLLLVLRLVWWHVGRRVLLLLLILLWPASPAGLLGLCRWRRLVHSTCKSGQGGSDSPLVICFM